MAGAVTVTVVGPQGRVGAALAEAAARTPGVRAVAGVLRGQAVPGAPGSGPVLVATHAGDLGEVIRQTPPTRRRDLVFLQNGAVAPVLAEAGLRDNTQALLYLSAGASGDDGPLVDGGQTVVRAGIWAEAMRRILGEAGVTAGVLDEQPYAERSLEKLLWASIFWLGSAAEGGAPVGALPWNAEGAPRAPLEALVAELILVGWKPLGLLRQPEVGPVVARLLAYTRSIDAAVPSVDMAVREFEYVLASANLKLPD